MINLSLNNNEIDLLDKILLRYEYEVRDRLSVPRIPIEERQSLENDLSLIIQIYNHLQIGTDKIKDQAI